MEIPFSFKFVFELALKGLKALTYLHSLKIAHRDIKPHNMTLDEGGEIRVIDFGCAKVLSTIDDEFEMEIDEIQTENGKTELTATGGIGTKLYLPPEYYDKD